MLTARMALVAQAAAVAIATLGCIMSASAADLEIKAIAGHGTAVIKKCPVSHAKLAPIGLQPIRLAFQDVRPSVSSGTGCTVCLGVVMGVGY